MRSSRWIVATMLVAVSGAFAQADKADKEAYVDTLDPSRLAETLAQFRMTEFLETFVQQKGKDSVIGQSLLAKQKVMLADSAKTTAEADALMDDAIRLLTNVVAIVGKVKKPTPEQILDRYRYELRLVDASGVLRVKYYVSRLLELKGGPADRAVVIQYTAEPAKRASKLLRRMNNTLQEWNLDLEMQIAYVPDLEDIILRMEFASAWVHFYRGMALADGTAAKESQLNKASAIFEDFTKKTDSSVMDLSRLMMGRAFRELGRSQGARAAKADAETRTIDQALAIESDPDKKAAMAARKGKLADLKAGAERRALAHHAEAAKWIARALDAKAPEDVRARALFANARNLIEWGKYDEAFKAIDEHKKKRYAMAGDNAIMKVLIDLSDTLLRHYLFDTRAAAVRATDSKKAAEDELQGFNTLFAFYTEHDKYGARPWFLGILAEKFRHVTRDDWDAANSLVLMALAMRDERSAEAMELFTKVIDRDDPISLKLRPLALWQRALAYNEQRMAVPSADDFLRIAREFPADENAERAARNGVTIYSTLVSGRREKGEAVAVKLQDGLIDAIEVLLGRWAGKGDSAKWYFNLGWEYQDRAGRPETPREDRIPRLRKAVAAYEKTPADLPESLQAGQRALGIRLDLLKETWETAGPGRMGEARKLAADMNAHATRAMKAAKTVSDKERAVVLKDWAAESELSAVTITYDYLDDKAGAIKQVRAYQTRWAGTPAERAGMEFEIRKLIEEGKTTVAIRKVKKLRGVDAVAANEVIRLMIHQIRSRIVDLRLDRDAQDELDDYRRAYLEFAKALYEAAKADPDLTPAKLIPYQRMLGDALVNMGKFAEGLREFQATSAFDAKNRQARLTTIEKETARALAAAGSAKQDKPALLRLVDQHGKDLAASDVDADRFDQWLVLRKAADLLMAAETEAQTKDALSRTAYRLTESIRGLQQLRIASLPRSAIDMYGLARAHSGLKQYAKALALYTQLARGLDRKANPKLYWLVQLDRCACIYEAKGADAKAMGRLALLIGQLRSGDKTKQMGGLRGQFNEVEAKAKKAAGR